MTTMVILVVALACSQELTAAFSTPSMVIFLPTSLRVLGTISAAQLAARVISTAMGLLI